MEVVVEIAELTQPNAAHLQTIPLITDTTTIFIIGEILRGLGVKERNPNNFPNLHPILPLSCHVLHSQKLDVQQVHLRFCSIRTYQSNGKLGASLGSYSDHVP